jgi:hypothetical protein
MGRAFPTISNAGGPASRLEVWNSAHVVQLFAIVLLTATSLFLPAVGTATSFVALIDGRNHRLVVAADCRKPAVRFAFGVQDRRVSGLHSSHRRPLS